MKETFTDLNNALNNCKYYNECEFSNIGANHSKDLSLLSMNINGLLGKQDDLLTLLKQLKLKFDIIAVSETHLNETSEKYMRIDNYNALFNSRKFKGWGGVALFIRSNLTFIPRPDINIFIEGIFESVFAEVINKGTRFLVGSIYRPPNSDVTEFFQCLSGILDKIKDKRSYIMGDFNLDISNLHDNSNSARLLDELSSTGFQPLISLPSRITTHSASTIDNIFTNDFLKPITSGLIDTPISDHLPTIAIFSGMKQNHDNSPCYVTRRDMSSKNKSTFEEWVKNWGKRVSIRADSVKEDSSAFFQQLKEGWSNSFSGREGGR